MPGEKGTYTTDDLKTWCALLIDNWAAGISSTRSITEELKEALKQYEKINNFTPSRRR